MPENSRTTLKELGSGLGTAFSSNLIILGSFAGIIVVEQAARHGVKISFGEFARAGVPVALACMALASAWIALLA